MIARRDDTGQKKRAADLIYKAVKGRIEPNRRFADDVLERIQEQNHQPFLERLGSELSRMEIDQKAGNLPGAHHRVIADAYKSVLEGCFC